MITMTKVKGRLVWLLVLFLAVGGNSTYAQQGNIFTNFKKSIDRADQYYADYSYVSAITLYKKVLEKEPENSYVKLKIARAYKKLNNPQEAENWYRTASLESNSYAEPLDQLYFAQLLMTNGKQEEAKHWLIRYTQLKKDIRAVNNLVGIENYDNFFKDSALYVIQNLSINSEKDDFSPVFHDNFLIFLSNRAKTTPIKYINTWTQNGFYDVYQTDLSHESNPSTPTVFNKTINSKYHEGPLAFYHKGQSMIFTRSIEQKNSQGERILGLFTAERSKDNKGWENIQAFPYNSTDYSIFHPAITEDGDTLYFASEMPGGYGGGDIYRSVKMEGLWSKPENMGSQINTEGNELFPYLNNNILYFSSDGHAGLGGLDIYQVELYKNDQLQVVNMGYPINSTYDDFSLAWHHDKNKGALSSNRPNGYGSDDIYFFQYKPIQVQQLVTLNGVVIDKSKRSPVGDASIYIIDEENGDDYTLKVDQEGKFSFQGIVGHSYTLLADNATKSGLLSGKTILDPEEIIEMEIWGFPPYIVIAAEIKDETSGQAIRLATVRLKENGKVISQTQTDFAGKAALMGSAGSSYTIEATNVGYVSSVKSLTIPKENLTDTLKYTIDLEKIKPKLAQINGFVVNATKNTAIAEATIYIIDSRTNENRQLLTQKDGTFNFEGLIGNTYRVMAEIDDNRAVVDYKIKDLTENQNIQLEINIKEPEANINLVALKIEMKDIKTREGIPFGVVKLFHEDTIRLLDYTNMEGELFINVEKDKKYLINSDVLGYKESGLIANTSGDLLSDTISLTLQIEQLEQQTLSGLAIDQSSGEKIAGAKIYLINETTGEEQEMETAADGQFTFRGKEGETFSVLAETDQKQGTIKRLLLTAQHFSTPVQIPLYDKTKFLFIAVNITDKQSREGVPLAEIQLKQQGIPILLSKSDIWGNAQLNVKAGPDYMLEINHAGYKAVTVALQTSNETNDSLTLAVVLERIVPELITMKGSVYMAGAQLPTKGAQVLIINKQTGESNIQLTDSLGNFEFQAKAGEVYNIIGDHQEASGIVTNILVEDAASNREIILPIQHLATLSPIVPDLQNNPLLTKSVSQIIAENSIKVGKITGYIYDKTTEAAVNDAMVYIINNNTGEAHTLQTDNKGFFQFNGRAGQEFTLLADKDTRSGLLPYAHVAHIEDTLKLGIWGFPPPVILNVKMLDRESKQPLRLAMVGLKENNTLIQQEQTQISGEVFLRALAGGKYQVFANSDGYEEGFLDFEISIENKMDTLPFELLLTKKQPQMIALEGNVIDESTGEPVDSVLVYIMNNKTWDVETAISNKNGQFRFLGLVGEQYQIIGEKALRGTNLLDIQAKDKHGPIILKIQSPFPEADKPKLGYLKVVLQDKNTGNIIPQGMLKLVHQDTVRQTTYTNEAGYKLLLVNALTSYYIEGSMKGYETSRQIISTSIPDQGDTVSVILALAPIEKAELIISGIAIEGTTSEEIANAQLYIRHEQTGQVQELKTGSDGKFSFKGIIGETYTILAADAGKRGNINKLLLVESHLSSLLQVKLYTVSIPLMVKVQLSDQESGAAIPLANLALSSQDTYQQKVMSNVHGAALFHAHSGKDYSLAIDRPGYKNKTLSINANNSNQDTIDLSVTLEKYIPLSLAMHGHVYDGENNQPLGHANIYIINDRNEETLEFKADGRGDFSFQATEGFSYTILADNNIRSGMISEFLVTDPQEKANPFLKIPAFGVLHPITVVAKVIDQDTHEGIAGATVKQYAGNILMQERRTASDGKSTWEVYKNEGYYLTIEKAHYSKKLIPLEFGYTHSGDTLFVTVPLKSIKSALMITSSSPGSSDQFKNMRIVHNNSGNSQVFLSLESGLFAYKQINNKAVLDNDKEVIVLSEDWIEEQDLLQNLYKLLAQENLKIQDTLTIENVYYGFDKSNLSPKAIAALNTIADIMKTHPEIKVELKAYTDSRGPVNYNMVLAKRRALSAFQYLVQQGISHTRIIQTPIGKADFVKDCSNTPCTEADHLLNRRTEMLIKYEVELLGNNE